MPFIIILVRASIGYFYFYFHVCSIVGPADSQPVAKYEIEMILAGTPLYPTQGPGGNRARGGEDLYGGGMYGQQQQQQNAWGQQSAYGMGAMGMGMAGAGGYYGAPQQANPYGAQAAYGMAPMQQQAYGAYGAYGAVNNAGAYGAPNAAYGAYGAVAAAPGMICVYDLILIDVMRG